MNIFENPTKYLKEIQNARLLINQNKPTNGSMVVAFFTKICKAGCPMCFFKSDSKSKVDLPEKQELSPYGYKKLVEFANSQ